MPVRTILFATEQANC